MFNLSLSQTVEIPLSDILAVQTPSRDGATTTSSSTTTTTPTTKATASTSLSQASKSAATSSSSCSSTGGGEDNNNQSVVVHYAGRRKDTRNLTWEKLLLSGDSGLCSELNTVCNCNLAGECHWAMLCESFID
ncbi:hypothetical protein ElyMa_005528200 [Elysia marginata]|uniref:Uncharacterized protein n=1 Tax=Elysia marginata TaxID=1093978 RepID=A0AAV4EX26_9GAST|nr:hypothetical protein ElyMa_005528200 [Elysia marginata]